MADGVNVIGEQVDSDVCERGFDIGWLGLRWCCWVCEHTMEEEVSIVNTCTWYWLQAQLTVRVGVAVRHEG